MKPRGRPKRVRSEIVTFRLDPKMRYLTELAARSQRKSVNSFVEWVLEHTLSRVQLDGQPLGLVADQLWDVDEPDRFVKLATQFPALLTYDEEVLWKRIRQWGDWSDEWSEATMADLRTAWARLKAEAATERNEP